MDVPGAAADAGVRDRALASGVRPAAGLLAALYGALAVLHQAAAPADIALTLSAVAAATAVGMGALWVRLGRRPMPSGRAPHVAGVLAALALGNSLLHLALTGDPLQTTNLMLVLVALGAIVDDDRWAAALAVVTVAGWAAVVRAAPASPMWEHFAYGLASAALLGAVLRVVRRRGQQTLEDARRRAASLATNDELTGLLNRRGLEIVADQALGVARRSDLPVLVLFCDLDGLKPLNDTLGHHAGDALLVDVARHLRQAFRDADAISRIGGDEFALLLVGADPGAADALRQRARSCLPGVGISVGAAVSTDVLAVSLAELLERADAQMYDEKRAKRAQLEASVGVADGR